MSGLVSRSEKAAATEDIALRTLIIAKIHDGHLPRTALPHVWGGPGHGATCSACEDTISKRELEIEAISWTATRLCSTFAAFSCGTRNGKRFKAERRTAVAAREREV